MIRVRPYAPTDREFLLSLAPRLTIGMPPWRDPRLCLAAVQGWINGSIEQHSQQGMVFVAEDDQGLVLGFATVTHGTHFSGERQASVGELATSASAEGRGVGKALLEACEQWGRDQGYSTLVLATGAANLAALGFYHHLGYRDEDITLVKRLEGES